MNAYRTITQQSEVSTTSANTTSDDSHSYVLPYLLLSHPRPRPHPHPPPLLLLIHLSFIFPLRLSISLPTTKVHAYPALLPNDLPLPRLAPVHPPLRRPPVPPPSQILLPRRHRIRPTRLSATHGSPENAEARMVVRCASTCKVRGFGET